MSSRRQQRLKRQRRNRARRKTTREQKIMLALGIIPEGTRHRSLSPFLDPEVFSYVYSRGAWRISTFGGVFDEVANLQTELTQRYFDYVKKHGWRKK